ncbi:MAG: quercetin 2,3-dioxygenase [Phycisphaeraceae bacterium]
MPQQADPIVRGPEDGDRIYAGGDLYRFLAVKSETGGSYGLWEAVVPPGGGPMPHLHRNEEEGFYVVSGEVTVYAGDNEIRATAGSFVHMPRGSKHWFKNQSTRPAKMLVLVAPGGMEAMFKETGTPANDPSADIPPLSDEEKARTIAAAPKYGIEIQPPHE